MFADLFARTVLDAKRLLLPWLATACAILVLDYLQPRAIDEWMALGLRLGKLYAMAGFSWLAWSELTGNTEEPWVNRYFARSAGLFAAYFAMGMALNIAGTGVASLLASAGPGVLASAPCSWPGSRWCS